MKIRNLLGIVFSLIIFALISLLLSQESSKKVVVGDKKERIQGEMLKVSKITLSEEERIVDDLKKQAGINLENNASKYYLIHCSSCHGKVGEGTMLAPSIKGKSYDYIISRLDDYRNDRVINSLMKGLLINTSDEELKVLAKEISSFE